MDDYDDNIYYHSLNGESEPCMEERSSSTGPSNGSERNNSSQCATCAKERQPDTFNFHTSLFLLLLAFRLANTLLLRTFFQPDEYWQSQEIAHRMVFGYGYQTWEWRSASPAQWLVGTSGQNAAAQLWNGPIRSVMHAVVFVPGYWIVKALGMEETRLLVSHLQPPSPLSLGMCLTFPLCLPDSGSEIDAGSLCRSWRLLHLQACKARHLYACCVHICEAPLYSPPLPSRTTDAVP